MNDREPKIRRFVATTLLATVVSILSLSLVCLHFGPLILETVSNGINLTGTWDICMPSPMTLDVPAVEEVARCTWSPVPLPRFTTKHLGVNNPWRLYRRTFESTKRCSFGRQGCFFYVAEVRDIIHVYV